MGSRTERLLLEDAESYGWVGLKVDLGGHGGYKTASDAGDLIIGRPYKRMTFDTDDEVFSELQVVEEKYKSTEANKYLQEDGDKFDAMIEFAKALGAKPVLACRWSSNLDWSPGATHYLVDAREVERTPSGNVSVKPETAEQEYQTSEEWFSD